MPKGNEVDEKAVLWRAPHGSGKWMHFEHEPKHLKSYEPLYSAATVAELRAKADAAERRAGELERACKPIIEKSIAISKKTSSVFTSDLRRLLATLTGADPT